MKKKSPYPYAIKMLKEVISNHVRYQKIRRTRLKKWKEANIPYLIKQETRRIKRYDDYIHQLKTALETLNP